TILVLHLYSSRAPPALPSFPTRRSSDLRRGDLGDVANLRGEIGREQVDVVGQILPGAADAGHHGLAAEPALGADLARHARHLGRSEEHTSELQSHLNLVCRLLLEKKKQL